MEGGLETHKFRGQFRGVVVADKRQFGVLIGGSFGG